MDELFIPACPDRAACLLPAALGCGLRLSEQAAHDQRLAAALASLIARRPEPGLDGLGAGDWAGAPVALVGEHAPAGIFPNTPELSGPNLFDQLDLTGRDTGLACRARDLTGLLERALDERYRVESRIIETDSGPVETIAVRVYAAGDTAAARRDGLPDSAVTRPALGGRPPLTRAEIINAPARVIACLDTREFIDPEAMGETPTLAGILRGASARALLPLLATARGSGLTGRWTGRRVIIAAPDDETFPEPDAIKADPAWHDITDRAAATLADHAQGLIAA